MRWFFSTFHSTFSVVAKILNAFWENSKFWIDTVTVYWSMCLASLRSFLPLIRIMEWMCNFCLILDYLCVWFRNLSALLPPIIYRKQFGQAGDKLALLPFEFAIQSWLDIICIVLICELTFSLTYKWFTSKNYFHSLYFNFSTQLANILKAWTDWYNGSSMNYLTIISKNFNHIRKHIK